MPSIFTHKTHRPLRLALALAGLLGPAALAPQGAAAANTNYSLAASMQPDRSSPQLLGGKTYTQPASIHVFTQPATNARRVSFYLDDPTMVRAPRTVETFAPFDFAGTNDDGSAKPLDVSTVTAGSHSITAKVEMTNGRIKTVSASFAVVAGSTQPPPPPPPVAPPPPPPPPPVAPPPPASTDPSGQETPRGDLPGWRQIFVDDFATDVPLGSFPAAVSNKWGGYPSPWQDTSKNGHYFPEKVVSIGGGVMDMFLHTETIDGVKKHLVAAPEPRFSTDSSATIAPMSNRQLYGRYAMRFRADRLPGYKTAWLLWPTSETWPRDGEIDFPEGDLDHNICAFMHRQNGTSGGDQDGACTSATYDGWHTAVIEWTPTVCRFILDGQVFLAPTSRIPNTPMRWILQTETSLGGIAPADSVAGHVQVDWVAAYAPA